MRTLPGLTLAAAELYPSVSDDRIFFSPRAEIINTGMWYYPLFYVVQSCVMNASWSQATASEGIERYKANIATDMVNCWKLWVPFQAINFSVVPVHMRVPFAAGVSFVWSCILSALRGDMKPVHKVAA